MSESVVRALGLLGALGFAVAGCGPRPPSLSLSRSGEALVERDDARLEAPEGRYASFASNAMTGRVETPEGARRAFTPPFPGKILLDVTVPESGRLVFYPALASRQEVRRAIVDFVVSVDGTVVYTETLDFEDANRWLERDVDLSPYAGRNVTLAFETRPFRGGADKLWADRVQTAWGDPRLLRGGGDRLGDVADESIRELSAWLDAAAGLDPETRGRFDPVAFAWNCVLGGGLGLLIRALYLRIGSFRFAPSRAFANLFPLFTVTTVLVITVVEASVALSLGLLGALSIVRFRTSIKTPEEITYLLFCVGIGLSLGAGARGLSVLAFVGVALFELGRARWSQGREQARRSESAFVLTLAGEARDFFPEGTSSEPLLDRLKAFLPGLRFHRMERDGDRIELSTIVRLDGERERLVPRALAERFPGLDIACVDADAIG